MNLTEEVEPGVYFYLANGMTIKNVSELITHLKKINDETYNHHVNSNKHDFANWIKDIYLNETLSDLLKKAKNKKYLIRELERALKEEERKVEEEKKKKEKDEKKRKEEERKGVKIIETPTKKSEILNLLKV